MNRWAIALLVSFALGACEPGKPDATTGATSTLPLPTVEVPRESFGGPREVTKLIAAKMNRFEPNAAFVPTGETVTFVNADSNPHHLVSGRRGAPDGRFEKDLYGIGISLDYEFPRRGTYYYHCTIHPDMNGQLTVVKVVFGNSQSRDGAHPDCTIDHRKAARGQRITGTNRAHVICGATAPRFLVLDEPFGALDTPTRATLLAEP